MTNFFFTTQVFELTRFEWSNATGLDEEASPQEFADAFEKKQLRPVLAEEDNFVHLWEPQPSLEDDERLGKYVKEHALTIPMQQSIVEFDDTIIVEYQITVGLVDDEEIPVPVKDAPIATAKTKVLLGVGAASGLAGYLLIRKGTSRKVIVGFGTGLVGMMLANQIMNGDTQDENVDA